MTRPNKRARVTSLLTNLHETELSHILSRLPTRDAARTSILSREWRYKWRTSYAVDIVDRPSNDPQPFVNFMNMILVSVQHFRRFRLQCESNYLHIQAWVNNALERRLENFDLQLNEGTFIILPFSLLNSFSLRVVTVESIGRLNVGINNFAPNLTCLELRGVEIANNHTTSTALKLSFPLLKIFSVEQHSWLNVTLVEIDAPSLTTFHSEPDDDYDRPYSLVILSRKITKLSCTLRLWEQIDVNGSSIVSANLIAECVTNLSEFVDFENLFGKMANEFTNLRTLSLKGSQLEVMMFKIQLPRLDMLRTLRIAGKVNAELLLTLLHKTPSLELLKFHMVSNESALPGFDYGANNPVPSCIVSHLEIVIIRYLTCETPQYNLLNFLLKNGKKLKKLILFSADPTDKQKEVEEYVSTLAVSGLVLQLRSTL